jgi:hypothetical protein
MKRQLERYFEIFPILAIILIMMAADSLRSRLQPAGLGLSIPAFDVKGPRLIFR